MWCIRLGLFPSIIIAMPVLFSTGSTILDVGPSINASGAIFENFHSVEGEVHFHI